MYQLTALFDFNIMPSEFLDMTQAEIMMLTLMKEKKAKEDIKRLERAKKAVL